MKNRVVSAALHTVVLCVVASRAVSCVPSRLSRSLPDVLPRNGSRAWSLVCHRVMWGPD